MGTGAWPFEMEGTSSWRRKGNQQSRWRRHSPGSQGGSRRAQLLWGCVPRRGVYEGQVLSEGRKNREVAKEPFTRGARDISLCLQHLISWPLLEIEFTFHFDQVSRGKEKQKLIFISLYWVYHHSHRGVVVVLKTKNDFDISTWNGVRDQCFA